MYNIQHNTTYSACMKYEMKRSRGTAIMGDRHITPTKGDIKMKTLLENWVVWLVDGGEQWWWAHFFHAII